MLNGNSLFGRLGNDFILHSKGLSKIQLCFTVARILAAENAPFSKIQDVMQKCQEKMNRNE